MDHHNLQDIAHKGVIPLALVEEMGDGSPVMGAVFFEIDRFPFIAS